MRARDGVERDGYGRGGMGRGRHFGSQEVRKGGRRGVGLMDIDKKRWSWPSLVSLSIFVELRC
jgi:hypothetical protein